MNILYDLASKYQADKTRELMEHYLSVYHNILGEKRFDIKSVLEIGVWRGGSIQMWKDYFPNALITGIDSEVYAVEPWKNTERIRVYLGRQEDIKFLEEQIIPGGPYDLIIDDGGHFSPHMKVSLLYLWKHVKPGGFYVVEDLGTSYWTQYGGSYGGQDTIITELKSLIDDVNVRLHQQQIKYDNIWSIQFFSGLCFIQKSM